MEKAMEGVSNGNNSNGTPPTETPSPTRSSAALSPTPPKPALSPTPPKPPSNSSTKTNTTEAVGAAVESMISPSTQKTTPPVTGLSAASTPSPSANQNTPRNHGISSASTEAPKSLRGLNKPKCSECGNVARSRCPYQACKSCCVKARNPCHIHVLKQSASFPEKSPAQSAPRFDQQRTTTSSNTFSHIGSARPYHTPPLHHSHPYLPGPLAQIRVKRPLSRKEITAINSWRFAKLKEYSDSKIEAEDEAFERYMQNVSLLEDVFSMSTTPFQGLSVDGSVTCEGRLPEKADSLSEDHIDEMLVEGFKVRLNSNTERSEKHKQRLRKLIDKGLQKLKRGELEDKVLSEDENCAMYMGDHPEVKKPNAMGRTYHKKNSLINTLNDKLGKVRNQEDLNACVEMYAQIFGKNISLPENVKTDRPTELHRSQPQGDVPDAIPSEQETTPMEIDGEEGKLENNDLFEGKEMQFLSNPKIYLKGWTEVNMPSERIQKSYEDLLKVNDIATL